MAYTGGIILFALGILISVALHEAGVWNGLQQVVFDWSHVLPMDSPIGAFLAGILGLQASAGNQAVTHLLQRQVTAERTTVLIAHRRSTLALADRIAVLDRGRVVDVGTEAELNERCDLFRALLAGPG